MKSNCCWAGTEKLEDCELNECVKCRKVCDAIPGMSDEQLVWSSGYDAALVGFGDAIFAKEQAEIKLQSFCKRFLSSWQGAE